MPISSWFPTFLYHEPLQKKAGKRFNDELIDDCYRIKAADQDGKKWSSTEYIGGYTSYASLSELHHLGSSFMDLQKKIDKHVSAFAKYLEMDMGAGSLEMSSCWVNIMPAQTCHPMHIHPLSVISGTYYVQIPKDAAGITFEDPRLDKFMGAPPKKAKHTKRNQQIVKIHPKAGDVVLFESWLRHEVRPSMSKTDLITISFNYDWV